MIPTSAPTTIASSPSRSKIGLVGGPVLAIAHVEPGVVEVARVRVLHHELADADEAATGARLVAELRLEVVDDHRQLAIALDDVAQEDRDDLLVGHREDHVPLGPVLEADQLRPDLEVAPALLPDLRGMDDGHLHLLPTDRVDLLADDLLDPVADPLAERQQRVDPGPELAQVAGAQQQPMRRHLGLAGIVAQGREEQLAESHGLRRIAARTERRAPRRRRASTRERTRRA